MKRITSLLISLGLVLSLSAQVHRIEVQDAPALKTFFSWSADRIPLISAHRGGPMPGFPENCIETFEHTLSYTPAIIECDVVMSKDRHLLMLHDSNLDRTTTGKGPVKDYTWEQLKRLKLIDNQGNKTKFRIPDLDQVLEWARNKVILTLDIKRGVPPAMVVQKIQQHQAQNYALVITYNLDQAKTYYQLDPSIMLSVSIRNKEQLEAFAQSGIPFSQIIVFMGVGKYEKEVMAALHQKEVFCMLGTMWNQDKKAKEEGPAVYQQLIEEGIDMLATDQPQIADQALEAYFLRKSSKHQYFKVDK
ncbi:MAG: glycerophosphodiester phosphodiesterase family protein [Bacteroidota bacterium]